MAGDVNQGAVPDLILTRFDKSVPGAEQIATPLDSFSIDGPNGSHQCIVLPILGPCVSPGLWIELGMDPGRILRKGAYQAALAMQFLHMHCLCHGDFRPSNILVKLNHNLNQLPEDELLALLGHSERAYVRTGLGKDLPASSPQYLTIPSDISRLADKYLTDTMCVIDFSEAYSISAPPEALGMPENYLPPEALQEEENSVGLSCDIWALACTLFGIHEQIPLFYMIYDRVELLAEMVRLFGQPPRAWWVEWEVRRDFFDDQGKWLRGGGGDAAKEWSLEVALDTPVEVVQSEPRRSVTPKEEQRLMAELLYKIFRYDPEQRLSVDDFLAHEWFK
ncbi:hypothetical protein ASPZODRAFT_2119916, partial [Penicilliopsis zonata CBS 506.65]